MNCGSLFVPTAWLVMAAVAPQSPPAAKPNFSGTWKATFAKSKLQIKAPESTVFVIDHHDPRFRLSRTHTAEGKSDTWGIELVTDGREIVREEAGRTLYCRLSWEGEALVFSVRIRMHDGEEMTDQVRYVMAANRQSFTAYESYRGCAMQADNVWILERQNRD